MKFLVLQTDKDYIEIPIVSECEEACAKVYYAATIKAIQSGRKIMGVFICTR